MQRLQARWNQLRLSTQTRERAGHYVDLREVLGEQSNQPIPGVRATLIAAFTDPVTRIAKFINANRIALARPLSATSDATVDKTYVVGKSPIVADDQQAVLLNAIETRQGLFQFVARRTSWTVSKQVDTINSKNTPSVLGKLLHDFSRADKSGAPLVVGKYTVTAVTEQASSPAPQDPTSKPNFFQRYRLDVHWTDETGSSCHAAVPISQVGLRFTGQVLQQAELEQAQAVFSDHVAQLRGTREPTIFSAAGIGRSATLMVHDEISRRIHRGLIQDEDALNDHIEQTIDQGRRDRSPHFIHSAAQFDVLHATLLKLFKRVQHDRLPTHQPASIPAQQPATPIANPASHHANETPSAPAGSTPPPTSTTTQPLTRTQTVDALVDSLGRAVIDTLASLDTLKSKNKYERSTSENVSKKLQLNIRVGELLRLQQVLIDLKTSPSADRADALPHTEAMHKALRDVLQYQAEGQAIADTGPVCRDEFGQSSGAAIKAATNRACAMLFASSLKSAVAVVENGGADALVREDEGNNCLLVSILQHASGNYSDKFHHDMATILREKLVAASRSQGGEHIVQHGQALFDDKPLLQSMIDTVNALYGRNLRLHTLIPGFENSAQTRATPGLHVDDSDVTTADEPIMILKKNFHYEAVVPVSLKPAAIAANQSISALTATGNLMTLIEKNRRGPTDAQVRALAECLQNERLEASAQIKAVQSSVTAHASLSNEVQQFFIRASERDQAPVSHLEKIVSIQKKHAQNLRIEKANHIAEKFNDRLVAFQAQFATQKLKVPRIENRTQSRWASMLS